MRNTNGSVFHRLIALFCGLALLLCNSSSDAQTELSNGLQIIPPTAGVVVQLVNNWATCPEDPSSYCGMSSATLNIANSTSSKQKYTITSLTDGATLKIWGSKSSSAKYITGAILPRTLQESKIQISMKNTESKAPNSLQIAFTSANSIQALDFTIIPPTPSAWLVVLAQGKVAVISIFGSSLLALLIFSGTMWHWKTSRPNCGAFGDKIRKIRYVIGKPAWTFDTSWASNLTALAGIINITGIIGLFNTETNPPQLLSIEQYALFTLILGSLFLFSIAIMRLLSQEGTIGQNLTNKIDSSDRENRKLSSLTSITKLNWIVYILCQGLIIASVAGQLALLVCLMLDLTAVAILPIALLLFGIALVSVLLIALMVSSIMTSMDAFRNSVPEADAQQSDAQIEPKTYGKQPRNLLPQA